jgi:diaminopimelate epimerase
MKILFTKAHGARNDFLLTWWESLHMGLPDYEAAARALCDRTAGVGADGWMLLTLGTGEAHAAIDLYNSDGSRSEISGNGTRCAAALVVEAGRGGGIEVGDEVRIKTGAGLKRLKLLERKGHSYLFEMNMGAPSIEDLHATVEDRDATIVNVGNPQCVFFVGGFDFPWQSLGARVEHFPRFPNRTNVSFVKVVDPHNLDVRFFERGAGETMSSGTGATGAVAAARARGFVQNPVQVLTLAGPLQLRWEGDDIYLTGPAQIIASGEFYHEPK